MTTTMMMMVMLMVLMMTMMMVMVMMLMLMVMVMLMMMRMAVGRRTAEACLARGARPRQRGSGVKKMLFFIVKRSGAEKSTTKTSQKEN